VAETGRDPEPLQRLSTRKVYVVTRRPDGRTYFVSTASAPIVDVLEARGHDFDQIGVVVLFLSGRHPIRIVVLCN
jgi:hypothetical protein